MKTKTSHTPGEGTAMAERINSAIDSVSNAQGGVDEYCEKTIRYLMSIQPDRKTQRLWDSAPDMLKDLKLAVEILERQYSDAMVVEPEELRYFRETIAKAEGK